MKPILYSVILTLTVILVGCEKTIDESELVNRNFTYFKINSNKPFTGKVVSYHENGQLKEIQGYKNGKRKGSEEFYNNGQLESRYKNGTRETYYRTGELKKKESYGTLTETYYESGELKEKEFWSDNIKTGLVESYYKTGEIKERQKFLDPNNFLDRKIEKHEFFYMNGNIKESRESKYEDWNVRKIVKTFFENGNLSVVKNYENSREVGTRINYFEDGNLSSLGQYDGIDIGWNVYFEKNGPPDVFCKQLKWGVGKETEIRHYFSEVSDLSQLDSYVCKNVLFGDFISEYM